MRFLVVDDVAEWTTGLNDAVTEYFVQRRRFAKERVRGTVAYDARQAIDRIDEVARGGWDIVLLDMNLGEGAEHSARGRISGLDLLADIASGKRAYFVIIVTGAVTDKNLEKIYGAEAAALMRFGAANEAVRQMPAAQVRILHKPDAATVRESVSTILPLLHSALDQYCSVSRERNIFRPLPGDPDLWEICYNGGPRLTLPHVEPFRMIQSALAQPNRMLKVTELIQRLAHSSGRVAGAVLLPDEARLAGGAGQRMPASGDGSGEGEDGLDWGEMDGFQVIGTLDQPLETPDGSISLRWIVNALLYASRQDLDLATTVKSIVQGMNIDEAALLGIPGIVKQWATKGRAADAEFEIENAPAALRRLTAGLRPVLAEIAVRCASQGVAARDESDKSGKTRTRVATGNDTREMQLARQHWQRFQKAIEKRPSLKPFLDHMIEWVDRAPTSRGHLYYRPPRGTDRWPFWLTE